tara:strand:+ start:5415 stop:5540 length:126 start_codon:yes stop_codon:yes gene_type:complete
MRRLIARTSPTSRALRHPDTLSLRDWADLPAHHPHSDQPSS